MRIPVAILLLSFVAACSPPPEPARPAATPAGPPADLGSLKISGPFTSGHLAIYIVEDPKAKTGEEIITLAEGLASGKVKVSEKGSAEVNELLIENQSDRACFVQAGDVVKGGQQDRAIGRDFVIPPKTAPTPVSSFCVEHSRWDGQAKFGSSTQNAYGNDVKLAIQKDASQQKVWDNVAKSKGDLRSNLNYARGSSSSLNEELDLPKVQDGLKAAHESLGGLLKERPQAIGVIIAVNGKFLSADLYDDPGLFAKIYPRLIESAALAALSVKPEEKPAPMTAAASAFLVEADKGKEKEQEIRKDLQLRTCENEKGVQFDYSWQGRRIHRQALLY